METSFKRNEDRPILLLRARHSSLSTVKGGFTLLEVMISLAIIGGLLVTLIYSLNYHLGIAVRHRTLTVCTALAREKMYFMENTPSAGKGQFSEPYAGFSYETNVKDSAFPGISEISVTVTDGKERIELAELVRKAR